MGWERRGKKRYYYRSKWANGRVVKQYFGDGPEAEAAALQDMEAAAERERRRAVREQSRAELDELMRTFDAIDAECDTAMAVVMAMKGYHKSRGVWRKKRTTRPGTKPAEGTPGSV